MPGPDAAIGPGPVAPAARCRGVELDYQTVAGVVHALRQVDAEFPAAQLSVVAGPSGSGKSSLLRVLGGLGRPRTGQVEIRGVDLVRLRPRAVRRLRRRAIGMVLQKPGDNLLPYLRAAEQVHLAARLRGSDPAEVSELLDRVGLAERARSYPAELSGGEQQRVAFAAAAVGRPDIVLADEPTAELDVSAGARLVEAMRMLTRRGVTLIVTSHDPDVIAAADQVIQLRDGTVHRP